MNKNELISFFKSLIVKSHLNDNPALDAAALEIIAQKTHKDIQLETPLSSVGLDSMTMTWIIVRFEEELGIDASGISFFELHTVDDLLNKIGELLP
jgi:acyl carrier protein